jgi:hypothetical protein
MDTEQRPSSPRDISDFRLLTASWECRFEDAYLLWDRAGAIWSELVRRRPQLKRIKAEPNLTIFRFEDKYEISVLLDKFHIVAHNPQSSLEEFGAIAEEVSEQVISQLEVDRFLRVGLRLIFVREYADRDAASEAALELKLWRIPAGPHFGIAATPVFPTYAARWEDKNMGCLVQINTQTREFIISPQFGWEGAKLVEKTEKAGLNVDVDYYTVAAAAVGQVSVVEWIKQAAHVVRRDINDFLRAG